MIKKLSFISLTLLLQVLIIVGCSDRNTGDSMLVTSSTLSSEAEQDAAAESRATKVIHVKEEYWDGESPMIVGKWYRFRSKEEVRKALKDMPGLLASFESFAASVPECAASATPVPLREKDMEVPVDMPLGMEWAKLLRELEEAQLKKKTAQETSLAGDLWETWSWAHVTHTGYTQYPNPVRSKVDTQAKVYWSIPDPYIWKIPGIWEYLVTEWVYTAGPWHPNTVDNYLFPTWTYYVLFGTNATIKAQGTFSTHPPCWFDREDHPQQSYTEPGRAKGDCNLDGILNIFDLLRILNFIAEDPAPQVGHEQWAGDLDDDGDCDTYDLVALLDILGEGALLAGAGLADARIEYLPVSLINQIKAVITKYNLEPTDEAFREIRSLLNSYLENR